MKKSWHPLLLKNQERVWLEEKKAVRISSASSFAYSLIISDNSSRRRKNLTSFAKSLKRNGNSKSFNVCRKSRRVRRDLRNWNGCIPLLQVGAVQTKMNSRSIYLERNGLTKC